MTDSAIIPVFDEIYESTYGKALAYVPGSKPGYQKVDATVFDEIYQGKPDKTYRPHENGSIHH